MTDDILFTTKESNFDVYASTFVTGERPANAYGIFGGRDDFSDRNMRLLWDGNLDAVEWILTGGVRAVEHDGVIVSRIKPRE